MQYLFFNNDSRFYKINVNLLNLLKDISTQRDLRDSMCLVVRSNFAKVTPPPLPTPMGGIHIFLFLAC